VDENLLKKVMKMKQSSQKEPIKTWARRSSIAPDMVGLTFNIHNGKTFISVFITEAMVGHKLGEFAPTRTFRSHGRVVERTTSPT
jgi:small subunit ribosomal protein S19